MLPCGWPAIRWGAQIWCPACGSKRYFVSGVRHPRLVSQRYRCRDCKRHFSVRKGTIIQKTKISLRDWVLAIHLVSIDTDLNTSKLTLHDALGISRATAVGMSKKLEMFPKRRKRAKPRRKWGSVLVDLEIRNLKIQAAAYEIARRATTAVAPPGPKPTDHFQSENLNLDLTCRSDAEQKAKEKVRKSTQDTIRGDYRTLFPPGGVWPSSSGPCFRAIYRVSPEHVCLLKNVVDAAREDLSQNLQHRPRLQKEEGIDSSSCT